MSTLSPSAFKSLLMTLSKRLYSEETSITNDALLEQFWGSDIDKQEITADIQSFEDLLVSAARNHLDVTKLGEVLKRSSLGSDHIKAFVSFWSNEREKIHSVVISRSTWNNHFKKMSWRIDVKAVERNGVDSNEPVALMELRTEDGYVGMSGEKQRMQSQFEMKRGEMSEFLSVLDKIQSSISDASY